MGSEIYCQQQMGWRFVGHKSEEVSNCSLCDVAVRWSHLPVCY